MPAILAVLAVAALSSGLGASPALLATLLLPAVVLALAVSRWFASRLGAGLLQLDVEAEQQ